MLHSPANAAFSMASPTDVPTFIPTPRPSSWPIRRERRATIAQNNLRDELCHRVEVLENSIVAKIEAITSSLSGFVHLRSPQVDCSSLQDDVCGKALIETSTRIDRLETLFVASPAISPSVDEVLSEVMRRKSHRDNLSTKAEFIDGSSATDIFPA